MLDTELTLLQYYPWENMVRGAVLGVEIAAHGYRFSGDICVPGRLAENLGRGWGV